MNKADLERIKSSPVGRFTIATVEDTDKLDPVINELIQQKWQLIRAYERLEKQYAELLARLTDTFNQEIIDHEGPGAYDAKGWQDEYIRLNRDMLAWMQREREGLTR